MDISEILDVETKSARISATLDHRPELASVWRKCAALSEASANLSLEDVPVKESDVIKVMLGGQLEAEDPQAARIARAINQTLLAPGHLMREPDLVFERAHRAGRLSSLIEVGQGGRVSYPRIDNDPDWSATRKNFAIGARKILRSKGPISLRSIAVARLLCELSPERHPIAERIVMMAAESYLRQDLLLTDPIVSPAHPEISKASYSHWTFTPATSLSVGKFRAWSPASLKGQDDLISGLTRTLQREAGRIGRIQNWSDKIKDVFPRGNAKTAKSKMSTLCHSSPVLDTAFVQEQLGCTSRMSRIVLAEAEETGVLNCVTNRATYKIWMIPEFHAMTRERLDAAELNRQPEFIQSRIEARQPLEKAHPVSLMNYDDKIDDILSGLDDVMHSTDRLLAKYATRRTKLPD